MIRSLRLLLCLGLALSAAPRVKAFSLLGPYEAWQVTALGYGLPGDIGAPKNLDEGYRWNLPVITYAFDSSFINYFGPRGMAEVQKAISIINNLPSFSDIYDDGTNLFIKGLPVPLDTRLKNYEAGTLGLLDLKSVVMCMLVEELGLAQAERWVWALRNAYVGNQGGQAYTNYSIIQYNYSPTKPYVRTPYVNGVYYTYTILKDDVAPIIYEDPEEMPAQIYPLPFSSVSGFNVLQINEGEFYTGLTMDDVGGLRYLYHRDRVVVETVLTNTQPGKLTGNLSPWVPFFTPTNLITVPTNFATLGTNATATSNLLVNVALRPGINKLYFQRVNYDSLLGNTFVPITNYWEDTYITNGQIKVQPIYRVITRPDLLFICDDLGLTLNGWPHIASRSSTTNWVNNDALNGNEGNVDGGPGVIQPPIFMSFSNRLPYFMNSTGYFLGLGGNGDGQESSVQSVIWGSFDATTNAMVVYPKFMGLSLDDLRAYTVGGAP